MTATADWKGQEIGRIASETGCHGLAMQPDPSLVFNGEVSKELTNRLRNLHLGCPEVSSCILSPEGIADSRYAYYNSKEGHHAMAAEHGH